MKKEEKKKEEDKKEEKKKQKKVIAGWMIIPTLFLLLIAIISLTLLFIEISILIITKIFSPVILILLSVNALVLFSSVSALVLEFKRKKGFAIMAILSYWFSFALVILAGFNLEGASIKSSRLIVSILVGVGWTLYFLKSKQVKNLFVKK